MRDTKSEVKGEMTMKDRKTMKSGMMWLLLSTLLAIAMVFAQTSTLAQVACPTSSTYDSDGDGFTDKEECDGIWLADNSHFTSLDPNKKDLFLILIPASPTNFPPDALQFVYTLPINIHLIQPGQATSNADYTLDRIVSSNSTLKQKAVRITESLQYDAAQPNLPLGTSGEGTPNGRDSATVFTERIKNLVSSVYGYYNQTVQDDIDKYVKHVIAHEFGHMVRPLAPVSQADYVNFGGYHYKSGTTVSKTNVILDQYVKYTVKGGNVIFYIGTIYTPADIAGVTLRQE